MTSPPAPRLIEVPTLSTTLARAHIDALTSGEAPPRAVVVGPAGAGKSRILRHLRRELVRRGAAVSSSRTAEEIASLSSTEVLFVDDAHLLDEAIVTALIRRIADDDAALILAARPAPHSAALRLLTGALERSQPAIVLGHVTRVDIVAQGAHDDGMSRACADDILTMTGGATWLVAESLEIHGDLDCADDPRHASIQEALEDVISHRLRSTTADVRELVENLSLAPAGAVPPEGTEAVALRAYAEGLLQSNGRLVPVVRSAARAAAPLERLIETYTDDEESARGLPAGIRDDRVASALLQHADAVVQTEPSRADELYLAAADAGADPTTVAVRRAQSEWALGNVEAASALLDAVSIDARHPDYDAAADTAASIWSARGLAAMSDQVYRSHASACAEASAHAAVAALAVSDRERVLDLTTPMPTTSMPSTRGVSSELLLRGIRESIAGEAHAALAELVRAAEMYTSSGATDAVPELPAVLAALTAVNLGELDVAHGILDAAVREGHGGAWAEDRLTLWRTWVALQQERAHDVEAAVQALLPRARRLSPRDKLLFDAISLAIARRYHDAPALATAWRSARESLLRARFDLFSLLPLAEFIVTAARIGESDRMRPHLADALERMERLGAPPLWSAHLHWAGIQQGILLGRPDELVPHARALVEAAAHNDLAATMAQAGRVWTSVLSGSVDVDLVESAAMGLASVGLAWDGARLAGHGAARSEDRRVVSRLLACARRLHPREDMRPATVEDEPASAPSRSRSYTELSPREREVAALVVEGKTYAEIGSAIFISPRTAEHHIARIRRRLGATNRSDLIAKLRTVLDDDAPDSDERDERATA